MGDEQKMTINPNGSVSFDEEGTRKIGIIFLMGSMMMNEDGTEITAEEGKKMVAFLNEQSTEQITEWLVTTNSFETVKEIRAKYRSEA